MKFQPVFPTVLHDAAARDLNDFFLNVSAVDTVLVVNSCARGQAAPESDLDFAILVKPGTTVDEMEALDSGWQIFSQNQPDILRYKASSPFAHLHLDIISGNYVPTILEAGVVSDFFEIEIGNQICYAAPLGSAGSYFQELQQKWLPYYDEKLRLQRLKMTRNTCEYELNHLPHYLKRGMYFHAFDVLYKAFQAYLQVLFIAQKTYPIAYNKWIKYQVVDLLGREDLYPKLPPILSIRDLESEEIGEKAKILWNLLEEIPVK